MCLCWSFLECFLYRLLFFLSLFTYFFFFFLTYFFICFSFSWVPPIFIQYSLLDFHLTLFSLGCLVILFIYEMVVFYFLLQFRSWVKSALLDFYLFFLFISILSFYISDSRNFLLYWKTYLRAFNSVWIFVLGFSFASWLAFMGRIFISWFLFCYCSIVHWV